MKFAQFDPRQTPAAKEHNQEIIAKAKQLIGIEVTIPALANQCELNIDPQHTDNNVNMCALDYVLSDEFKNEVLPKIREDATLVTLRTDSDSIAAMCVIDSYLTSYSYELHLSSDNIQKISDHDKFIRNPVFQKQKLNLSGGYTNLEIINALMLDFKIELRYKIATMRGFVFLNFQNNRAFSRVFWTKIDQLAAYRIQLRNDIIQNKIKFDTSHHDNLCVIETTHHNAPSLAYSEAPVAICVNKECTLMSDEPYLKYTICAYNQNYANIKAALNELNSLEKGWGGSPTIGGSPQGFGSQLDLQTVIDIVKKHIV